MVERRSKYRAPLRVVGTIDFGTHTAPCLIVDLSEHGMALLTNASEEPDGPVQVRFRLGGLDAAVATIDAEVVDRRDSESGVNAIWGLRSIGVDLGTRTRVRGFVRRLQQTEPARWRSVDCTTEELLGRA